MKVEAYFENIHQVILEELNNAKESIYVAILIIKH